MTERSGTTEKIWSTNLLKTGFAKMQQGGVIMDVVNAKQAHIAEDSGAVAVMALERVPADIRAKGGVARMSHPDMIKEIMETTSIPVMAKARIGHEGEARVLESLGVDMIDESEVLTPADPFFHIAKKNFEIPFVCGCTNLGEAVRRIAEGASMIRTKGEAGTGNVVSAVQHARLVKNEIDYVTKKLEPTTPSSFNRPVTQKEIREYVPSEKEKDVMEDLSAKEQKSFIKENVRAERQLE